MENLSNEVLKDIEGFPNYMISNFGYVISKETIVNSRQGLRVRKQKILKPFNSSGYLLIGLYKNGKLTPVALHRLLAIAFIPNPLNKRCVNHIDHNKLNNNLENLEWVTHSENNNAYHDFLRANGKKINYKGKSVINIKTGVIYPSITQASLIEKLPLTYFRAKLKGLMENDTDIRYYKKE